MSHVNWIQLFNNFTNNVTRVMTPNNVKNDLFNNTMTQQSQQQTSMQQLFPNTAAQLSQTAAQLATLNQEQSTAMLKDLLNLPKNFEQLLSQLTTNPKNIDIKNALMLLASTSDLSKIASLLQNNSKMASANLYQLLAQYNQLGISLKEEQMNHITKLIAFVASASTSDVQSLKTLLLMYLPWLPLMEPNSFRMEIIDPSFEDFEEEEENISVLMSTENHGSIQADLYKTDEDGITIYLMTSMTFPQEKLINLMKEESKKYNVKMSMELGKKEEFNAKDEEEAKVFMNVSSDVNPFLLLIANVLINHIHSIDMKASLVEKRKEKLDNGKS